MAAKPISVSGFDFTVKYPVVDMFKALEKICRSQGRIFEIFWVKVQKFKKPLRELRAKIRKSVFADPSNFSCLPPRQTLANYIEDKTLRTFLRRHASVDLALNFVNLRRYKVCALISRKVNQLGWSNFQTLHHVCHSVWCMWKFQSRGLLLGAGLLQIWNLCENAPKLGISPVKVWCSVISEIVFDSAPTYALMNARNIWRVAPVVFASGAPKSPHPPKIVPLFHQNLGVRVKNFECAIRVPHDP